MNNQLVEILLVDDNILDAELVIRELKRNNLANNLHHVKNGKEALDFIFARGVYEIRNEISVLPKIILLDIQMPKMNGIEVLAVIKADDRTKSIPTVILTSSGENSDIQKCYELGANSYLVKAMNFDGFKNTIQSLGIYWLLINQPPVNLNI